MTVFFINVEDQLKSYKWYIFSLSFHVANHNVAIIYLKFNEILRNKYESLKLVYMMYVYFLAVKHFLLTETYMLNSVVQPK